MKMRWQARDPWAHIHAMVTATYDQRAFRFRYDDGDEATATWVAAQNATISEPPATTFRLRLEIQETASGSANNQTIVLQYRINEGNWTNIDEVSTGVRLQESSHVANNTATTDQLTAGTGAFLAGIVCTTISGTNISFAGSDHTEVEWCMRLVAGDVAQDDVVQFRVTINGALANTVTATPQLTVAIPAPDAAPTISLVEKSDTAVHLQLGTVANATTYRTQRKLTGAGDETYVTVQDNADSDVIDSGLASDTSYTYRAQGRNTQGDGPWSAGFEVTTDADVLPPLEPTLLVPVHEGEHDVKDPFTWEHNPGTPGDVQEAFAFRRGTVGNYEWWDGSTWVATETFVTSPIEAATFPPGAWE